MESQHDDPGATDHHHDWVERLTRALVAGIALDLRGRIVTDTDFTKPWSAERHVPASALKTVLTSSHRGISPRGLILRGAWIDGGVDLEDATILFPVTFEHCVIPAGVYAARLHIKTLIFSGCKTSSIRLPELRVEHSLLLRRTDASALEVEGATIGGHLILTGATLTNPNSHALDLDGADIKGDLVAQDGFTATGEVRAPGATIGGRLSLSGATLNNPNGRALYLDGADIKGNLIAQGGFTATGEVRAVGATIGGQLSLSGATLNNPNARALDLDGADIKGTLFAQGGFTATGEVRAVGATIGGQLVLANATLNNPNAPALTLDDTRISFVSLQGITTRGEVRAIRATIGGRLSLVGATLNNPNGRALTLDGADIKGDLFAQDGFTATGEVRAVGATIGGQLTLSGATLTNPNARALYLDGADIKGNLIAQGGFTATGEVRAPNATIGGQLTLVGATLNNPNGHALTLDGADIKAGLFAQGGFTATGEVRAPSATIGGQLALSGATLNNPNEIALNLHSADIRNLWLERITTSGTLNLTSCHIGDLYVDATPPQLAGVAGWRIGDISGRLRHDCAAAVAWLKTSPGFTASPYEEIARLYDRNGQPVDARRVRLSVAHQSTAHAPWYSKPVRWIYAATVGYGYYPLLATVWLLALVGAATFLTTQNLDAFLPTMANARPAASSTSRPGCTAPPDVVITAANMACFTPSYPELKPLTYALTTVSPASAISQPAWAPLAPGAAWLEITLTTLKLIGWLLTVMLLAGLTGLLRKG